MLGQSLDGEQHFVRSRTFCNTDSMRVCTVVFPEGGDRRNLLGVPSNRRSTIPVAVG